MSVPGQQILIIDERYMANLLTEEICGDGSPLGDMRVEGVTQDDDGSFVITMEMKEAEA